VKILFWLAVPLVVTALAMAWVAWTGQRRMRPGHRGAARTEAAYERFGAAVQRPVPEGARRLATQQRERPSGIAVRSSTDRPG